MQAFEKTFDSEEDVFKLQFNKEHYIFIKDNLVVEPASLPMVCEPLKWSETEHGGYLQNEIIKNDIITGSKHHNHIIITEKIYILRLITCLQLN